MWDVFISYASEDLEEVARPLAKHLTEGGLRVWFDSAEFRGGESIRERLDIGLSSSNVGVIIASNQYFAKRWTLSEMDAMIALEMDGRIRLVVVRHGLTHHSLMKLSILLAGRSTLSTDYGVESLAFRVAALMKDFNVGTFSDPVGAPAEGPIRLGPRQLGILAKLSYLAFIGGLLSEAMGKSEWSPALWVGGCALQHIVYSGCFRVLGFLLYGSTSWLAWVPVLNLGYMSFLRGDFLGRRPYRPSLLFFLALLLIGVVALSADSLGSILLVVLIVLAVLVGGVMMMVFALAVWFLPLSLLFYRREILSLGRPLKLLLLSSIPVFGSLAAVRLAYPDYGRLERVESAGI